MSHLRVLICRVEDESDPDRLTELHRVDLPAPEPNQLQPPTALDDLETQTLTVGHTVMRQLLLSQWQEIDHLLVQQYQQLFPPRAGAR